MFCNDIIDNEFYCARIYVDYGSTLYLNVKYPKKYAIIWNFNSTLPMFRLLDTSDQYYYIWNESWYDSSNNYSLNGINIGINGHNFYNFEDKTRFKYIKNNIIGDIVNITVPIPITKYAIIKDIKSIIIILYDYINEPQLFKHRINIFAECMCLYIILYCLTNIIYTYNYI